MPPTAAKLINAVNHPLRRRILFAFLDGSRECASAEEVAEALGESIGQVAYHLKTLAQGEVLEPVQGISGGRARQAYYGWALDIEPEWLRVVLEVWAEAEVAG
ncbi:MAG TPA: helix-turn-helix domain-containing protein [Solirubrobacterales bacterium]|nr:helix-turn-helix domain-containing protein [Solirubrobacterales bacterium]